MKRIFSKKEKGFTLVETLVAISILLLSIASAFTAVQSSLSNLIYAKDRIAAFYLVQEAAEYVRNVRDTNLIWSTDSLLHGGSARNWLYGFSAQSSDPCYFGKVCVIDSPLGTATACSGSFGTCPNIRQDPLSSLYGYTSSWTQTNFKREIMLTSISANEAKITISISWSTGSKSKTVRVEQTIFNK